MTWHDSALDEVRLGASRMRWLAPATISGFLSFVAIRQWVVLCDPSTVWFVTLMFVPITLFCFLHMAVSHIRLDREGFEESVVGWKFRHRWRDLSAFEVYLVMVGPVPLSFVRFQLQKKERKGLFGALARLTLDGRTLLDVYGGDAKALVELLNAFRERAIAEEAVDG